MSAIRMRPIMTVRASVARWRSWPFTRRAWPSTTRTRGGACDASPTCAHNSLHEVTNETVGILRGGLRARRILVRGRGRETRAGQAGVQREAAERAGQDVDRRAGEIRAGREVTQPRPRGQRLCVRALGQSPLGELGDRAGARVLGG